MLVLGCKVGQKVYLDSGRIVVTVTQIRGSSVQIGVDADKEILVERESVYRQRIEDERRCLTPCEVCEQDGEVR